MQNYWTRIARRAAVAWVAVALGIAAPVVAQAPDLAMLNSLTKGAWTLRIRDTGAQQRLCLRDGRELIQLEHKQPGCGRFVVTDEPGQVVVQYTCRGNGYGRTSIRKEGSGLVQVQTQGIHNGTPFSWSAEGRHVGSC